MFGKKKYSNDNAINEIVGTMLLLGISVSIFSIVYISVLTIPYPSSTPSSNIYFSLDETKIVLTHFGGKELDLESDVRIIIGDEPPINVIVSDFLAVSVRPITYFWNRSAIAIINLYKLDTVFY